MPHHDTPQKPRAWHTRFLAEQKLPEAYLATARRFFDPLSALLANEVHRPGHSTLVGVNGSQGSGKSTLCDYLTESLRAEHGLSAIALSLDDFYLTRAERVELAARVHPLLATRGVPGTHDVALLRRTLHALRAGQGAVVVPRFDKAMDDRAPRERWSTIDAPVDLVLLEGWCLGARRVDAGQLKLPCNALERDEDPEGIYRGYINRALGETYEALYGDIGFWVMLAAPGFERVLHWRREQEAKLRSKTGHTGKGLMDDDQLLRFVAHFERNTRQCLEQLPSRMDVVYDLGDSRDIVAVRGLGPAPGAAM